MGKTDTECINATRDPRLDDSVENLLTR